MVEPLLLCRLWFPYAVFYLLLIWGLLDVYFIVFVYPVEVFGLWDIGSIPLKLNEYIVSFVELRRDDGSSPYSL